MPTLRFARSGQALKAGATFMLRHQMARRQAAGTVCYTGECSEAQGENPNLNSSGRRGMLYLEEFVQPMREELTRIGFQELRTSGEVDHVLGTSKGTVLVVVNSICGCAAGRARPAVAYALAHAVKPDKLATVFAGQDQEATAQARSYFTDYPPSSPSIALLRDGKLLYMIERHDIEGRMPEEIAADLTRAFDRFCTPAGSAVM